MKIINTSSTLNGKISHYAKQSFNKGPVVKKCNECAMYFEINRGQSHYFKKNAHKKCILCKCEECEETKEKYLNKCGGLTYEELKARKIKSHEIIKNNMDKIYKEKNITITNEHVCKRK